MRSPMEIYLSITCTSTEESLTETIQSTLAYKRDMLRSGVNRRETGDSPWIVRPVAFKGNEP